MGRRDILIAALIAACAAAALFVDLVLLPIDTRLIGPDQPRIYLFASLIVAAAAMSLSMRSPGAAAWTALFLTAINLVVPLVALIQDIDISIFMVRRTWLVMIIWVIALTSMLQQRRTRSIEASRQATTLALHQLEDRFTQQSVALETIESRDRSLQTRLEHAQQLAGLGSWEQDLQSGDLWWSDEIYRHLGLDPATSEVRQDLLNEALEPASRALRAERIRSLLETGASDVAQLRLRLPGNTTRIVEEQYGVVRRNDGCVVRIIGTMYDVTQKAALELEVTSLNEKLRALTEIAFDAVIVTENGAIVDVSPAATHKLGYSTEELIGTSQFTLVAPPYAELAQRTFQSEQTKKAVEIALIARDGTAVDVEYFATNVKIAGRQVRVIGIRDIGERVSTERALATTAEDERTRIGFELHDHVGQVLVGTKWAAERLVSLVEQAEQRDSVIVAQAERVSALVAEAIEEVRRVSARLAPRVLDSAEIYSALQALCIDVNRGNSGIQCRLESSHTRKLERQDAAIQIYRIAEEAVTNAIRHSGGTEISIGFERRDGSYVLDVIDNGRGITDSDQRQSGVGLRSMRHRARLLDGSLEIAATAGEGTRVTCIFPAQARHQVA